jgi:hypothetical protein
MDHTYHIPQDMRLADETRFDVIWWLPAVWETRLVADLRRAQAPGHRLPIRARSWLIWICRISLRVPDTGRKSVSPRPVPTTATY